MTVDRVAYSVDEAAEAVGVSAKTIRRAVADGELTLHRLRGTMPRIRRVDLDEWVASAPTERQAS